MSKLTFRFLMVFMILSSLSAVVVLWYTDRRNTRINQKIAAGCLAIHKDNRLVMKRNGIADCVDHASDITNQVVILQPPHAPWVIIKKGGIIPIKVD